MSTTSTNNDNLIVSQGLMQDTVNYLATRPFNEVHILIAKLIAVKPLKQRKAKKDGSST